MHFKSRLGCAVFLLAAACGTAPSPSAPPEPLASVLGTGSEALLTTDCPWGANQCSWPGTLDESKGFKVGSTTTGAGTTAKLQRSDLLAKFTMQGSAFLSEVRLSAYREGT